MTKKLLLCLGVSLAAIPFTWAAPLCVDGGTIASYVALGAGGCQIGDKIFANFAYSPTATGGATAVPATSVIVDTVGPSGQSILGPDYGVQFAAPWSALAGQTNDAAINFTVAVIGGGPMLIDDAALAQASAVTPNGLATVTESGCGVTAPATSCIPGVWSVMTFDAGTSSLKTNGVLFTATGMIDVVKDIDANGGSLPNATPPSSASISIVQDVFSQTSVPEPVSMGLLGGGLLLLGAARWRRGMKKD